MSRRASTTQVMVAWLHSLADDPRERFGVLDRHAGRNDHTWHELRPDFAAHLDQARGRPALPMTGAQILQKGRAELQRQRPDLARVVEARHFALAPSTQEDLAHAVGITQQAVSLREQHGVEWLYDWCQRALGVPETA